jgi:hypothetical protein
MNGLTLDAGALIALERNDRRALHLLEVNRRAGLDVAVPAGVLGQVWRDGKRQALLARLLASDRVTIEVLDGARARAAATLCGARGTSDVIDASVVLCARLRGHTVLSSDPDDLRRLDPSLSVLIV